jgi:hypothetical protein
MVDSLSYRDLPTDYCAGDFEEGHGPHRAAEPMMMMMMTNRLLC